jgi:hypothetical protein
MTNETKDLLMQYLFRVAEHYQINKNPQLSFKKRNELLEKLQVTDKEAFTVTNGLFESFLTEDRIRNDNEKKEKKPEHWNEEFIKAEKNKVEAEMNFVKFCKAQKIPLGGVIVELYPENKL